MTIDFGQHEDVFFKKAPLSLVLTQIRFSPILSLVSDAALAGFQEALRDQYPHLSREQEADFQIGARGVAVHETAPVWRLSDAEEKWEWRVSIAVDFVSLETTRYREFDFFAEKLHYVIDAVRRTLQPSPSVRLGLRKVNDFTHPSVRRPSDWKRWLRPEFLGLLAAPAETPDPFFGFADARYSNDEGVLAVRHGLPVEGDLTYRVDLDYFTDRPYEVAADSGLVEHLKTFSDGITSFFHWILTPEMYTHLEPTRRASR